ncbi:MAG: hypothetical protein LBU91_09525 [Bacteroidales bacterium]|jgi:hypothetical protein|nr:hypothetical protein [Bacteroidales bacterium]
MKTFTFKLAMASAVLLMMAGVTFACKEKEKKETCDCNNKQTVYEVNDLQGTINFNSEIQKWYISVHTSGTIDNVRMFFPCNMTNDYEKEMKTVTFSGSAFDFDGNFNAPAGYEYFCVELSSIDDISVCGVNDPLQNIEWLRKYCESLDESQDISSVRISLYKTISEDEYFFLTVTDIPTMSPSVWTNWKSCSGETVFTINPEATPEVQERYEEFVKTKELVAELFHFVKP